MMARADRKLAGLCRRLAKAGVPWELHAYEKAGGHGVGLAPDKPHISTWPNLCRLAETARLVIARPAKVGEVSFWHSLAP